MQKESYRDKKTKSVNEQVKEALKESDGQTDLTGKFKKKSESFVKMLIYYSLPLFGIALFVGILVFGTVPTIKGTLNYIDEKEEKEEEVDELEEEISRLKSFEDNQYQINSDLKTIDKIVSSQKTQVAKFVGEIESLAEEYSLEESKHESGEQIKRIEEEIEEAETRETASVIHIPTTSEYVATFNDIKDFLDALYEKDDFIIVSSLDMQGYTAREYFASLQEELGEQVTVDTTLSVISWTMEVTFKKYQFSEGFDNYIEENMVTLTTEPDEETLEFIRERYSE